MTAHYSDQKDYRLPKICEQDFEFWAKSYIEGRAALAAASIEAIDELIGALKIKRPTQKMSEKDLKMFLKITAKLLCDARYGYFAIERGIRNLLNQDKGDFFPTDAKLRKYIHPIHSRFKLEMDLLGRILEDSYE